VENFSAGGSSLKTHGVIRDRIHRAEFSCEQPESNKLFAQQSGLETSANRCPSRLQSRPPPLMHPLRALKKFRANGLAQSDDNRNRITWIYF
jgi:hypothetical protein